MIVMADEMARAVRVAIDMNASDTALLADGDADTLTLNDIIFAKLADAARLVTVEAPHFMLESGHEFGDRDVYMRRGGKGYVILPDDFLRLVSFRMSDWERTVYEAISETDPVYAVQQSRYMGVCGNPQKPVVAVVRRGEGKVLEFYSCADPDAVIEQAVYVPIPRIDGDGGIDVPEDCYRAAVYRAAALALSSVGDQLATTMLEISRSLLTKA